MDNQPVDLTPQIRQRLLILIEQVKRDGAALDLPKHAEGGLLYTRLFDSLRATLHNLDCTEEAAKPCGRL